MRNGSILGRVAVQSESPAGSLKEYSQIRGQVIGVKPYCAREREREERGKVRWSHDSLSLLPSPSPQTDSHPPPSPSLLFPRKRELSSQVSGEKTEEGKTLDCGWSGAALE